jgi:histidinol-phosphatase (PHP family)
VDNIDIYTPEFYQGRSKQEVYRQYFVEMLQCVTCYDTIHSLGHIDYIARYAKFVDTEIYYSEFKEQIDEILTALATKGKALEINTRRLGSKEAVEILMPIYQRFYEVGGQYVTIGSDAHRATEVGRGLAEGLVMADRAKLKVVYFKDGQPQYIK